MTEPLNPCLICGDHPEIGATSDAFDRIWIMVQCPNGCRGNSVAYEDEETAIAEWNNWNPPKIKLPRLLEEYQRAIDEENKRIGRDPEDVTIGISRDERWKLAIRLALHFLDHAAQVCSDGGSSLYASNISRMASEIRSEMGLELEENR